jgi:hypothetical protein
VVSHNNYIIDGDLENGNFSWLAEGSANASVASGVSYTGTKSLSITTNSANNKVTFHARSLKKNAQYMCTLFVNNANGTSVTFRMDIHDSNDTVIGNLSYTLPATSPWTLITLPFTSPNISNQDITVKLYGGNVYVDDIRVTEGSSMASIAKHPLDAHRSVTTATRPVNAFVGQPEYDKTLGLPIVCKTKGNKEWDTLTINTGASVSGNITITLNGVAVAVAVLAGDSASAIADKIKATAFPGWNKSNTTATNVNFIRMDSGTATAPSFSDTGSTGVTASMVVTTPGTNNVWQNYAGTVV